MAFKKVDMFVGGKVCELYFVQTSYSYPDQGWCKLNTGALLNIYTLPSVSLIGQPTVQHTAAIFLAATMAASAPIGGTARALLEQGRVEFTWSSSVFHVVHLDVG